MIDVSSITKYSGPSLNSKMAKTTSTSKKTSAPAPAPSPAEITPSATPAPDVVAPISDPSSIPAPGDPSSIVTPSDAECTDPAAPSKKDTDLVMNKIVSLSEKLIATTLLVKELTTDLKIITKEYLREKKVMTTALNAATGGRKGGARRRKNVEQREPTKSVLSNEMSDFLCIPHEQMMSRRDVINGLNKYIKDNKLQSPEDGRQIVPDTVLRTLLDIDDSVDLNYFNMQRYINRHFVLSSKEVVGSSSGTGITAEATSIAV